MTPEEWKKFDAMMNDIKKRRWRFWKLRDELDGLIFGIVLGLIIMVPLCWWIIATTPH